MCALNLRVHSSLSQIAAETWDACAGPDNPFVSHAFLLAMEQSGTACPATGWIPQHLSLGDPPLAVVPVYLKTHSEGEFVFDYGWASAYQRAGGRYYPKLQVAVPYSPVPGPRLLVSDACSQETLIVLRTALVTLCERLKCSSVHVTFCGEQEQAALCGGVPGGAAQPPLSDGGGVPGGAAQPPLSDGGAEGWLARRGLQYHWHNQGYASFEDFLGQLTARKRKALRKERQAARSQGLSLEALSGSQLGASHWDAFYSFYLDTSGRKWGRAALKREFFDRLGQTMGDRVVLMLARDGSRYVAGALNLLGRQALFGRNWGCLGYYPFLHFELCYYMAIDFAIERGLARVEAGAQGMHKVARGYEPVFTYSAHYLRDPAFRAVLARHLEQEGAEVEWEHGEIASRTPFRAPQEQE